MPAANSYQPIKLVIWDLDDTFWQGTLSEGSVTGLEANLQLVRDTAARGIVHTIVSKNDFAPAEARLRELGIWEMFVFARISWQPKGPIIKELLSQLQLRAANALFLDDNAANRAEAQFYSPDLRVADPTELPQLAPLLRASGQPDPTLSRLAQYKLLERQQQARTQYNDNLAFLRDAQVQIEFREGPAAVLPDAGRLEELINRSNQLNFTKRRVTLPELEASLRDPARRWGTVRVHDRFGDYGLVGIYCLNRAENRLEQFVFSCRILHLGIEQFTYAHLGFPALEVRGEVATELSPTEKPTWITVAAAASETPAIPAAGPAKNRLRVLLKGGCDLGQLTPFLQAFDLGVTEEFNFNNEHQIPVHLEHTLLLRATREWPAAEQQRLAATLPFLGREAFDTRLWEPGYDVLVYSPLMDYTQPLYRERATGHRVPFGAYQDITAEPPAALATRYAQRRFQGLGEDFLRRFAREYEYKGPISLAEFQQNLRWLRTQVPAAVPIFLLNGAEIEVPDSGETGARARHETMNQALAEFVASAENCFLLDVREFVRTPADVSNNLRHYHRRHYRTLAQHLAQAIGVWQGQGLAHSPWADWKARAVGLLPAKLRNVLGQ
ncbi:hypothetical protein [Hymenobacter psychrophilus]|uniref:FkbH-like domain-containing protein n=1 Tax=Hymenobacter psychrophilus TaxID=651662 RepID=A0A1H3DMR5_9BACT|nr:hypothetical protein [Hymenobacter psychrophilus]SDX67378.1 FkbH-like domain-containing protein [Hymenobacter psychrophilus]